MKANNADTIRISVPIFEIHKDLILEPQQVLIAEPGTEIVFFNHASLTTNGSIILNGTAEKPVILKSVNDKKKQGLISLLNMTDSLVLSHVNVINTRIISKLNHVILDHVSFQNDCDLKWNESILTAHGGSFLMEECIVKSNNSGEGILCHNIESPIIRNNTFKHTPDAIEFIQCENGKIINNNISKNNDDGIDLNGSYRIEVSDNLISDVSDCGVEIDCTSYSVSSEINIYNNEINQAPFGVILLNNSAAEINNNKYNKVPIAIGVSDDGEKSKLKDYPNTISIKQNGSIQYHKYLILIFLLILPFILARIKKELSKS